MQSKRTFIAIKIEPEKVLTDLFKNLKSNLKDEKIKWVEENNLHLTLRFLGETSQIQFQQVDLVLRKLASDYKPFCFNLQGTGFFGRKTQPKVLFISVLNTEILSQFADNLVKSISDFGFQNDEKPFAPHLTLGRIKQIQNTGQFLNLVQQYKNVLFQQVLVNEIIFYESILLPTGPIYKPLIIYKLNKQV